MVRAKTPALRPRNSKEQQREPRTLRTEVHHGDYFTRRRHCDAIANTSSSRQTVCSVVYCPPAQDLADDGLPEPRSTGPGQVCRLDWPSVETDHLILDVEMKQCGIVAFARPSMND